MSDLGESDAYRQLSSSPKSEGTSSQPVLSGYTADDENGTFIFRAQSEGPFPPKKRGWFSRDARERRKRMRKYQQQRMLAAAKRETDAYTQDVLNRRLANFNILATTATNPDLEQAIAPQLLPVIPTQPMEVEDNPENQVHMHDFNPEEIPIVPELNPEYDPWLDDHRDYQQRYQIPEDTPMMNLADYPGLDPLDPYNYNDQYVREMLENPYPYPIPQFPNQVPEPAPPMSAENVQELRTVGEEILESSERIRQVGERLVWKYDERNMEFGRNPYP